jgi:DNA-binding GntR family transcriptional regulator
MLGGMKSSASRAPFHREKVYQYVKNSIITHSLLPGDMIYERSLAERLGVSLTPVREAIQCLPGRRVADGRAAKGYDGAPF